MHAQQIAFMNQGIPRKGASIGARRVIFQRTVSHGKSEMASQPTGSLP
jgi:hypothetical protein